MLPTVVGLDDDEAREVAVVGAKAAALAVARRAGLRTVDGAVLTTAVSDRYDAGGGIDAEAVDAALRLVAPDGHPVIARSSSVVEDQAASSQAGQFETVLDVRGSEAARAAVEVVLRSRAQAHAEDHAIAVLVQPMVEPSVAGVAFGVDPVTGRSDRRVVTAVGGQPDRLVSGEADGSRWLLDEHGGVLEAAVEGDADLSRSQLRELAALGARLEEVFGGPQDVEWAVVDGELVLLQSRPVTTVVRGVPSGPVYGPGPVAETFPEPLSTLEVDLWVPPLRHGAIEALRISGAVSERTLAERELVVVVDGRVAMDLEITGEASAAEGSSPRRGLGARLRRLGSAWRIGRLRAALPLIAEGLAAEVDRDLEQVPAFSELSTRQLVALIERGRAGLRSLHAHEILMGMVSETSASGFSGASVALRVLVESRLDGHADEEILARSPVVLALVPPKVGAPIRLPSSASVDRLAYDAPEAEPSAVQRESLRLRVRWMQELVGQAAYEIGARLARQGLLDEPEHVRHLSFDALAAVVARRSRPDREALVAAAADVAPAEGLPARFQLSDLGRAVAVARPGGAGGGTGAGGGIGSGPVTHDADDPPPGSVLVVPTLSPQLGPHLHHLAGIVSETGSVLSHLAILAREHGVATVVAYPSVGDLVDGMVVTVDGDSGQVDVDDAEAGS
ncbi:MAG: pyruvate, phosphate dikinase [Actinobacteria bacterium]|nr:pyruvate, phosphate dikinase [Actinomycetota bacterium]